MISRPDAAAEPGRDLGDDRADHRGGGRQPQRRQGTAPRPAAAASPASATGRRRYECISSSGVRRRRLQPAQRADGHREEREVGRDDRHRHPRLPVTPNGSWPPQPTTSGRERDEGHGLARRPPTAAGRARPVRSAASGPPGRARRRRRRANPTNASRNVNQRRRRRGTARAAPGRRCAAARRTGAGCPRTCGMRRVVGAGRERPRGPGQTPPVAGPWPCSRPDSPTTTTPRRRADPPERARAARVRRIAVASTRRPPSRLGRSPVRATAGMTCSP